MRIGLAAATVLAWASAQPALAEWRYAPDGEYVSYRSTDIRRDGAKAEFSGIRVQSFNQVDGLLVERRTFQVDCASGVGRKSEVSAGRPVRMAEQDARPPKAWGRAEFLGDPQDPKTAAGFACAAAARAPEAGDLPTLAAAVKDAIGKLRYPDVEAAYRIDTPPPLAIPPYRRLAETPETDGVPGRLDLAWRADDKAAFVLNWSFKRQGHRAAGLSLWAVGMGRAATDRVYMLKDFDVDCRSGALALYTRAAWPTQDEYIDRDPHPRRPVDAPGEAEKAFVATACGKQAPLRSLASVDELTAFAAPEAGAPAP